MASIIKPFDFAARGKVLLRTILSKVHVHNMHTDVSESTSLAKNYIQTSS